MNPNMYLRYFKSSHYIHRTIEENIKFIQAEIQRESVFSLRHSKLRNTIEWKMDFGREEGERKQIF